MERRQAGMGAMMPFFPGPGMGEQPPLPPPEMPPFPHMRERFPNAVWGGESPQGQWPPPPFHPPGLGHPPMVHPPPPPPPHQFNQFEPRQPMFNFPGGPAGGPAPPVSSVPVSQYNSQYNDQFTSGGDSGNGGYVPQGHFSPQTPQTSVPGFSNGPPNGFLNQSPGNGVVGGSPPHPHRYPGSNDFHQQQQQQQGGMFKSPMASPAVSAPEASPVTGGFTMTTLPSPHAPHTPHASEHPNEKPGYPQPPTQNLLGSRVSASGYSGQALEGGAGVPQGSPHGTSSVQSRLKNMIMSRQSSSYPGGGVDSPPLGEVHFSGHVAAVTSVSRAEPEHMEESLKMAQNFLAYRTAESGPGSVVQANTTDVKGGAETAMVLANTTIKKEPPGEECGTVSQEASMSSSSPPLSKEDDGDKDIKSEQTESVQEENMHTDIEMKNEYEIKKEIEVNEQHGDPPNTIAPKPPDLTGYTPLMQQKQMEEGKMEPSNQEHDPDKKPLSIYDFPDSPESLQNHQDFRFGRVRGTGPCISRPACANMSGGTNTVPPGPTTPVGQVCPRLSPASSLGVQPRPPGPPVPAIPSQITNFSGLTSTTTTTTNSQAATTSALVTTPSSQPQSHQNHYQHWPHHSSSCQHTSVQQSSPKSISMHPSKNVQIDNANQQQKLLQGKDHKISDQISQQCNSKPGTALPLATQHPKIKQEPMEHSTLQEPLHVKIEPVAHPGPPAGESSQGPGFRDIEALRQRLRQNELDIPQCSCPVPPGDGVVQASRYKFPRYFYYFTNFIWESSFVPEATDPFIIWICLLTFHWY
ncbi:hypothetical protein SK128_014714 [Halocaridina rubra]|uniref:Uncharacterized protein n=1 Tax=Halocaridina rubra TaxID=373956 RepID=A0AAN8ZY02_HALRR